jgi:hypothetical protein
MDKGLPSHGFPTQPYVTTQEDFELSGGGKTTQSSQDFTRPLGASGDFVSASKGGTFYGLISYDPILTPSLNPHIPNIGWVKTYVQSQIGSEQLTDAYIRGLISSSASTPLTYNNGTGVFTLNKNLSAYTNDAGFLTALNETDPTVGAHIKAITPTNISNWNTAFGWGNHASAGYKKTVTKEDVTAQETFITITTSQISDFSAEVRENLVDLDDFPISFSDNQVLRRNADNNAFEFHTLLHSNLGTILGSSEGYHLSQTEAIRVTSPASISTDGYLTSTDWNTFNDKLDNFTPGNLLSFTGTTLNVDVDVLPTDDTAIDALHNLSAEKIYALLAGSGEEGSFSKSYTITISAGDPLTQKLINGSTSPDGWSLTSNGGDLIITHNLGITPVSAAVYLVNAGVKSKLEGNNAYSSLESNTTDNKIILYAYAGTISATEIRIIF